MVCGEGARHSRRQPITNYLKGLCLRFVLFRSLALISSFLYALSIVQLVFSFSYYKSKNSKDMSDFRTRVKEEI